MTEPNPSFHRTVAGSGFGKLVAFDPAHQLDPQSMVDVIVDVVLSDNPK